MKQIKAKDKPKTLPPEAMVELANTINKSIESSTDPRELAYSLVATYIWDREKLKSMARISWEQVVDMMKAFGVGRFYVTPWGNKTIIYDLIKTEKPPYYRMSVSYQDTMTTEEYVRQFFEYLNDILELTVSIKGKGREEGIKILQGAEHEITIKDKALNMIGQ